MKLTGIILLAGFLQVSARTTAQTVTYAAKAAPLTQVLAAIEIQTGYHPFYNDGDLVGALPVTVDLKATPLRQALMAILENQPLTFEIQGNTIDITRKAAFVGVNTNNEASPPPGDLHGRVVDSSGNPLVGASVTVKGTKKGVQTDSKGEFDLKGLDADVVLVVTFTGYKPQQVKLGGRTTLTLVLSHNNDPLDEVQVIAYGTTTPRYSTGDVTTVSGADIEKQPVDNPLLALEGRVPGMFITQQNGLPGSGVIVQIRGQNSISNGNDPFYVVDGVPYASELLYGLGSMLGSGGINNFGFGSPLSYINPADIESISVLKDADATAIYGSRAANGAILITTRRGKAGKMKVDINLQDGSGQVTRKLDLLNTQQYLQMRREAFYNDSVANPLGYQPPSLSNAPDLLFWDTTIYTDWQKVLIGGIAQYTNLNANVSGGNPSTQYLVGATYHRQTAVFPGTFADQKGNLHFNLNSISVNQKFQLQLSANYLLDNNQLPQLDLTNVAILTPPDAPPLYNKDGSLNWADIPNGYSTWPSYANPLSYLYQPYHSFTYNLIGNLLLSYQLLPGLGIKTSLGYNNLQTNEYALNPLISYDPPLQSYYSRSAKYVNNNIHSWIIEPQITYKRNFGKGRLDALFGGTVNQITSNGDYLEGNGYNSDLVLQDIHAASSVSVVSTTASVYKYAAVFGRLNYAWDNRYLANVTVRRDGSSRFGPANQMHDFEAAGIGWIFSEERFIKVGLHFLSFGKLRASYGTTGNDQIGDYKFMNLYSPTSAAVPYQGAVGLSSEGLTNPYLQWEETHKLEFGGDLGFLKDRILVNGSYFRNRSSKQLLGYNLPYITGFNNITLNFPAVVQNAGWEFSVSTVNIRTKNFNWTTGLNLSVSGNKLLAFPKLSSSSYASQLVIGQPLSLHKVFHLIGVNDTTGIYEFSSVKGGTTYNPVSGTDNTVLVNTNPKFYGGLQNSFRYKGVELDFLFQFVKQIGQNYFFGNIPGTKRANQPVSVLNSWRKPGDKAPIQRYNQNSSIVGSFIDALSSDASYSDASFIRLKNVSLAWQLPGSWTRKSFLQNVSVYLQGQNLLTFTHYKGMDPENLSTTSLPPLKVITFGVKLGL